MRLEIRTGQRTGIAHGRGAEVLLDGRPLEHVVRLVLVIDVNDAVRLYTQQLVAPVVDIEGDFEVAPLPDDFDPGEEWR